MIYCILYSVYCNLYIFFLNYKSIEGEEERNNEGNNVYFKIK